MFIAIMHDIMVAYHTEQE